MSEPWPDELERIASGSTFVADFVAGCECKPLGTPCGAPAVYLTEYHPVNFCRHPSLEGGNIVRLVCENCLDDLHQAAAVDVYALKPRWWQRRRNRKWPKCPSCDQWILKPEDVLRVISKI